MSGSRAIVADPTLPVPGSVAEMVTEGANRVGPRDQHAQTAIGVVALVVLVTAVAMRWRRGKLGFVVTVFTALAAAIPGLRILATQRPDSPARAEGSAARIEAFRSEVEGFARAHTCARVVRSSCPACDPVVHFALANIATCDAPAAIVLGRGSLGKGCHETDGTLMCGDGPG